MSLLPGRKEIDKMSVSEKEKLIADLASAQDNIQAILKNLDLLIAAQQKGSEDGQTK